jgi:hypothetical protein
MVIDGGDDEKMMTMMMMQTNCSSGVQSVLLCCANRYLVCKFVFPFLFMISAAASWGRRNFSDMRFC